MSKPFPSPNGEIPLAVYPLRDAEAYSRSAVAVLAVASLGLLLAVPLFAYDLVIDLPAGDLHVASNLVLLIAILSCIGLWRVFLPQARRKQMDVRRVRLGVFAEGLIVDIDGAGHVTAPWTSFSRTGLVVGFGWGDGLLLREPIRATGNKWVFSKVRGIALERFERDWRQGDIGTHVRRLAPHISL